MENKDKITQLQLELSTYCNSNCTMCLRDKLERTQGTMPTERAINIIEEAISMGVELLKPQWFGETLLANNWKQIVGYAKGRGMKIMLITNGSLMDKQNREFILANVDKIFISIDSHNRDVYEKIRRGLKFDRVVGNIKSLYEERKKVESKTTIFVTAVELEETKYDIEGFKDFFKSMSDRVTINQEVYCKAPDKVKRTVVCQHRVDRRLVVGWDGKCYLCCHDWLGKYEIGDLNKNSMQEIWEGDDRKFYLKNLNNLAICQQCMLSSEL